MVYSEKNRRGHYFFFALAEIAFIILFRTIASFTDFSTSTVDPITYVFYGHMIVLTVIGYNYFFGFSRNGGFSQILTGVVVSAYVLQWGLLVNEFWRRVFVSQWDEDFTIEIIDLIGACYTTVAVLITYGVLNGKASLTQMLWIGTVEVVMYGLNKYILRDNLNTLNLEHHLYVHEFGAVFGLGALFVLGRKVSIAAESKVVSSTTSNYNALLGTLFIFAFFPTYNAVIIGKSYDAETLVLFRNRAIVNTYLAIASSALTAFAYSSFFNGGRWNPVDIRNASLAGGIGMASSIAILNGPDVACALGIVAALATVLSIRHFDPVLHRLGLRDSSNAFSTHFVGGALVAAIGTMVSIADAHREASFYGVSFKTIYPSANDASPNHVAAFFITFGIALLSGMISAFVFSCSFFDPMNSENAFVDHSVVSLHTITAAPVAAAVPVKNLSRREFAGYSTQQVSQYLKELGLAEAADLVAQDGIIGDDIVNAQYTRMQTYFGESSAATIWAAIGQMEA